MSLSGIPAHLLAQAAADPRNSHAAETLLRAAGQVPSLPTPTLREEGAQEATGTQHGVELRCPIDPVGKPRQTQSDKWRERPAVVRYREFADELRAWAERVRFHLPESRCTIRFDLPMPDSWSKAKRAAMGGEPHQQRPDVDNLTKAVFDALLAEDCRVWHVSIEKRWARDGAVVFVVS